MAPDSKPARVGAWAGIVGPALFVLVFTVEGWLRPGYEPARMYVSALSMGPRGWIQISSFLVAGLSFLLFARAIAAEFPTGAASRAGPILFFVMGVVLLCSGPMVMDPQGTPIQQMTWHGLTHQILGAIFFSLCPVTCFVFLRRFLGDPAWKSLRAWTLIAGVAIVAAIVLMKVATLPPPPAPPGPLHPWVGLIQRVALVAFMGWVFSLGWAILERAKTASPAQLREGA